MKTVVKSFVCSLALSCPFLNYAQIPVKIGGGSIASFPPAYKAKTVEDNSGFNATRMLSRKIYADELPAESDGILEVPGRCLPTNDWWTDLINSKFSGALWSYPAMLSTSERGVRISWPTYWADSGKELKSETHITVSALKFQASAAIAKEWHDWDVVFRLPSTTAQGEITVTSMHGSPFTWFEYSGLAPCIEFSRQAEVFSSNMECAGLRVGNDLYGIYHPSDASWEIIDGKLIFDIETPWIVIALLRSEDDLHKFAGYAVSRPLSTQVKWTYDESSGRVESNWTVEAENLRDKKSDAPVLQGFLPHAYKYALSDHTLSFIDSRGYMTPRGNLRIASSASGSFEYSYQFSGMLPVPGTPGGDDAFRPEIMDKLMADYASSGTFGGDTYWGGKGLTQMAMNMWFARQTGNQQAYETSRKKLRDAFENWLTYTPGEDTFFFSYYPRWGGMLGFDVSYDSDAFNDHHFHYGYFIYAAALLCMDDKDFAEKYGEILKMIAKDYANWDREDKRFPFMRTLDIWNGHSWAGGLGDHGNDNGNGQESSSEAMQAWGGLYLLGVALGDKEMRNAGIWGWSTEARATREYWFDVDAPRTANAGGRKSWPGKGSRQGNYNYDEYPYAYNSNITGKGIGWWTWFGGDPLFMHGIQWMPVSPALDYLSWDSDFTAWAMDDMLSGANSAYSHSWFDATTNSDNGESIEPLACNDWGNVALAYLQRSDPRKAAEIFDTAFERNLHIASAVSTGHISYYTIHSHLAYGDPDFSYHADIPTSQVCIKDGIATYIVYNPDSADREVHFYDASGKLVKTVMAPALKLAEISADPVVNDIEFEISGGNIIPPGENASVRTRVIDQYGAGMPSEKVTLSLSEGAPAVLSDNILKIKGDAPTGSEFTLTLTCEDVSVSQPVTVNQRPLGISSEISGVPELIERGNAVSALLTVKDQYGLASTPSDTKWRLTDYKDEAIEVSMPLTLEKVGKYKLTGVSSSMNTSSAREFMVTPLLPLISQTATVIASSAENAGTMPENINDGKKDTRWGSAHTDDEWVLLDLGEDCFITRVSLLWEAAFASRYLIQTAPDGCAAVSLDVSYAGQSRTVTVPLESEWTTVCDVRISSPGEKTDNLNSKGRYVRIKGLERATGYGYSIFEMGVYGRKTSSSSSDIIGVDFILPPAMDCNDSFTIVPEVCTYDGSITEADGIAWSSDRESKFQGNVFTPLESGMHTVTASLPGGIVSEGRVFVNEMEKPVSIEFERDSYTAIKDYEITIPFTVTNQFMAPFRGGLDFLEIRVTDLAGNDTDTASYNPTRMTFTASSEGEYIIEFGILGKCRVSVKPLSEINLALDKPSGASSENAGNSASFAFDGSYDTRWESEWADNQSIEVSLGGIYMIDRSVIVWEAAHAISYILSVSDNGIDWRKIYEQNNCKGGTESFSFTPVAAGYVRLDCLRRATGYGFSVWEWEIYGISRLDTPSSSVNPLPGFDMPGAPLLDTDEEVIYYNLQGIRIPAPVPGQLTIIRKGARSFMQISQ